MINQNGLFYSIQCEKYNQQAIGIANALSPAQPILNDLLTRTQNDCRSRIQDYTSMWGVDSSTMVPFNAMLQQANFMDTTLTTQGPVYLCIAQLAFTYVWGWLMAQTPVAGNQYAKWIGWRNTTNLAYFLGTLTNTQNVQAPIDFYTATKVYDESVHNLHLTLGAISG